MILIFYYSSQDADHSNSLSRGVTVRTARLLFPDFDLIDENTRETIIFELNKFVRKAAHFTVFFTMGAFVYGGAYVLSKKVLHRAVLTIVVCSGYACFDEFHQSFIPGRAPLLTDVFIDTVGAILGAIICGVVIYIVKLIIFRRRNSSSPLSAS